MFIYVFLRSPVDRAPDATWVFVCTRDAIWCVVALRPCVRLVTGAHWRSWYFSYSNGPPGYRNDLKDLYASGDAPTVASPEPLLESRIRPPLMFGVFAQKAQMYTLGSIRREAMLMHSPWSHISQDSLHGR